MRVFFTNHLDILHEIPSSLEVLRFGNAVTVLARYHSWGASPLCSWSALGVLRACTQGPRSRLLPPRHHAAAGTATSIPRDMARLGCLQNKGYDIQAETPGRHHITISESSTCFSDPKVLSLKSFPENGCKSLGNSSCWLFPFAIKLQCWLWQILSRTARVLESYWHLWLFWHILMENILSLLSSFWPFLFSSCSFVFPTFLLFPSPWSGSNSRCFSSVVETVLVYVLAAIPR